MAVGYHAGCHRPPIVKSFLPAGHPFTDTCADRRVRNVQLSSQKPMFQEKLKDRGVSKVGRVENGDVEPMLMRLETFAFEYDLIEYFPNKFSRWN